MAGGIARVDLISSVLFTGILKHFGIRLLIYLHAIFLVAAVNVFVGNFLANPARFVCFQVISSAIRPTLGTQKSSF